MPLSEDANRILEAFKNREILVGQWVDDRRFRDVVLSPANLSSALQQLADRGYIRIQETSGQFALTDLGHQVINGETISRQNWKPWRPSSDRR